MSAHTTDLAGTTAIVTGASRGLGRGIATALVHAGATVVGVARSEQPLRDLRAELGDAFLPVTADAADPEVARTLITQHHPRTLILNAGATPPMGPIHEHTWETFSHNWNVDTRHVFHWTRETLRRPLDPDSLVVVISSAAALQGSPTSGGYAGAKAATRFIASYAAEESRRHDLGIRFIALLPQLTPATDLGAAGVEAYARRESIPLHTFIERLGPPLTPEQAGTAVVDLATGMQPTDQPAYRLSGDGLTPLASSDRAARG